MAEKKKPGGRGKSPLQGGPWARSKPLEDAQVSEIRPPKNEHAKKQDFTLDSEEAFPSLPHVDMENNGNPSNEASNRTEVVIKNKNMENSKVSIPGKNTPKVPVNTFLARQLKFQGVQEVEGHTPADASPPPSSHSNETSNKTEGVIENKNIDNYKIPTTKKSTTKEPTHLFLARQLKFNLVQEDEIPTPAVAPSTVDSPASASPPHIPEEGPKKVVQLSPYAKEFVPSGNYSPDPCSPATDFNEKSNEEPYPNLLEEVEETVLFFYQQINESPGSFDNLMTIIVPHFYSCLGNQQMINKIVDDLYAYSINDCSFSYHAIKMLMYLMNVSSVEFRCKKLQNKVMSKAQKESLLVITNINRKEIDCNSILAALSFLSELYIQFEGDNGGRQWSLGETVAFILKKILPAGYLPAKERINTTVTIMKLTGTFLDMDDKSALDSVVKQLQRVLDSEINNLDDQTITAAETVLELRNNCWGMDPSQDNNPGMIDHNEESGLPYGLYDEAEAVFYGPDGEILGYEEQMFLECNVDSMNNLSIDDPNEVSPNGMDGEMEDAYNDFLLTIPQSAPVPMVYTPVCCPFLQMQPCQNGMVPVIIGPGPLTYNGLPSGLEACQREPNQNHADNQQQQVSEHPETYNVEDSPSQD